MIYITGDMHGPIDVAKFSTNWFPEGRYLTKNDYVIICGDFGLIWDGSNEEKYWNKWLTNKPWTTLFIDGNHENFTRLFQLPKVPMFDSTVRKVSDSIFYLQRGHVYNIQDKTFFVLGGASSHDKEFRKPYVSWWPEELPNKKELKTARRNLNAAGNKVDYVLTHCAPTSIQKKIDPSFTPDALTDALEDIKNHTQFEIWYFGHYHNRNNSVIDNKFQCLYQTIKPLI